MTALAVGASPTSLIPGDPALLRQMYASIQTFAQGFEDAANHLTTIGNGQEWVGDAAKAFLSQYSKHLGDYRTAGDAFATVLGPLQAYTDTLEWAQGQARQAVNLMDEAQTATQRWQAQAKQAAASATADSPAPDPGTDPGAALRSQAQSLLSSAQQQVETDAGALATVANAAADKAPKKPGFWSSAWSDVTGFAGGLYDSVSSLVKFVYDFSPERMLTDPVGYFKSSLGLAKGLWFGIQHPAEFGKALIDWKDWSSGNWSRALGELAPQIAITLLSGGAGAAAKGADAASALEKAGVGAEALEALEGGSDLAKLEAALDGSLDASLDAADRAALTDYTGSNYTELNNYLRNPASVPAADQADLAARTSAISKALSKLPAAPGVTFRGTDLPQSVLDSYKPGAIVSDNAFTSSSTDLSRAFPGNSLITIEGTTGRDVAKLSQIPSESEVLYDSGTKFKVLSKVWDPAKDKWLISLEEAP